MDESWNQPVDRSGRLHSGLLHVPPRLPEQHPVRGANVGSGNLDPNVASSYASSSKRKLKIIVTHPCFVKSLPKCDVPGVRLK